MKQRYYEELSISMYPTALLHRFGVNGKVSGSIYAAGEIKGVIPVIHGPLGCGYHYRYSARRRHYPFFDVIASCLQEEDIIFGGEEKLYNTIIRTAQIYRPELIVVIPSPISDILQDDIASVVKRAREAKNINVIAVKSELFSHRDKNYARRRLIEISKQKINQGKNLDFDIKGCGFTETLYALVNDVMTPQPVIPLSVNIETIGWGIAGKTVLKEVESTLKKAGVIVNTYFPGTSYQAITKMPRGALNIVRRLRWAKRMKEKYGTPFLQIGSTGLYSGLNGICNFYHDVGKMLGIGEKMAAFAEEEKRRVLEQVRTVKDKLKHFRILLITRSISAMPDLIKKYTVDYGLQVSYGVVLLPESDRQNFDITGTIFDNLMKRIEDAKEKYSKEMIVQINASMEMLQSMAEECDAIFGTGDHFFEKLGIPVIHIRHEEMSLSFESYVRSVNRIYQKMKDRQQHPHMLLNKMDFSPEHFPLLPEKNIAAAREMWLRMWLNRKEK